MKNYLTNAITNIIKNSQTYKDLDARHLADYTDLIKTGRELHDLKEQHESLKNQLIAEGANVTRLLALKKVHDEENLQTIMHLNGQIETLETKQTDTISEMRHLRTEKDQEISSLKRECDVLNSQNVALRSEVEKRNKDVTTWTHGYNKVSAELNRIKQGMRNLLNDDDIV